MSAEKGGWGKSYSKGMIAFTYTVNGLVLSFKKWTFTCLPLLSISDTRKFTYITVISSNNINDQVCERNSEDNISQYPSYT